jgi:hypothetical protein
MKKIFNFIINKTDEYIFLICLISIYLIITYSLIGQTCISKIFFGIPCPGCGLTHAGIELLHFNFKMAFIHNPLIYLVPFYFLIILSKDYSIFKNLYYSRLFWILSIIFIIIVFIIRMIIQFPSYELVFYDGLIERIIRLFSK